MRNRFSRYPCLQSNSTELLLFVLSSSFKSSCPTAAVIREDVKQVEIQEKDFAMRARELKIENLDAVLQEQSICRAQFHFDSKKA